MLKSIIRALLGLCLAVVFIAVIFLNSGAVSLSYSPVHDVINLPLAWLLIGFWAFGFLIGAGCVWMEGKKKRS